MKEVRARLSSMNLVGFAILFVAAVFALLWKLGTPVLAAWDEAIYAQVAKEIVETGNWLTLHWQYAPWFEKPPLFLWITAAVYRVFGVNEFGARLPSAVCGLLLLVVVYKLANLVYDKRVGLLASLILFTCYHFLSFARFGTMEIMLTLFTYVAVYGYLRARADRRWWYVSWAACGLGLMTKGAGGFIAPVAILLVLWFDKRLPELKARQFWQAFGVALVIAAPWHTLMLEWYGRIFINEYIGYHVIARATTTLEGHPSTHIYYLMRMIDGFFPMVLLAPFAIVSDIRNRNKSCAGSWILMVIFALVFLIYTAAPTRRPWYIVPLYPALAILIADFIVRWRAGYSRQILRRVVTAIVSVLLVVASLYSGLSLYLNRRAEEPVATLARLARSTDRNDRAPLIILAGTPDNYAQVPLFYSDRPVLQAYASSLPPSDDARRYVSFVRLADIVQDSPRPIILRNDDAKSVSRDYELQSIAESGGLVYATIKRRTDSGVIKP